MLKSIQPDAVTLGMFVHGFEGSWISHPFWRSRFVVDHEDVLKKLRASSVAVLIDTERGCDVAPAPAAADRGETATAGRIQTIVARASGTRPPVAAPPVQSRPRRVVAPAAFGRADRARAVALAQRSTKVVKSLFDECRQGRAIAAPVVLTVVDDIATTLEQNATAFLSITRLKAKDSEAYLHSVAVCALMINLARDAGLSGEALRAIGMAGLLHDVGKVSIDEGLLTKDGALTGEEMREFRRHPELGHALLLNEAGLPPVTLDVCLHHHERLDGSGYPFGLHGDAVSEASRIAAICDTFDTQTSSRPGQKGLSPVAALAEMEAAGAAFDRMLLFRFMRSIGVFPAGKLVRLRSNRLAVVLPSRHEDRCPVARVFYSAVETRFLPYEDVVLSDRLNTEQAIAAEDAGQWFAADWRMMSARIIAGQPALSVPGAKH